LDPNTSDKDKQILATAKHPRSVQNVVCHNSNNQFFFATASKDEFARVWNVKRENNVIKSADLQMILKGHVQSVEDVAINPSGNMICTASADRTLKLWEVDLDNSKTHLFATSEETEPKAKKIRTVQEYVSFHGMYLTFRMRLVLWEQLLETREKVIH
jgi:WD40 repeat protein